MSAELDAAVRSALEQVSTATLTMQLLKRGFRHCFMRGVRRLHPSMRRAVGPAYTLRYIPFREDKDPLERLASRENAARRAIEECPAGAMLVVDARGVQDAGTLGDILATRLARRGVSGFVSDGAVRDADALTDIGLPIFCAGTAAPGSPSAHLPLDLDVPIGCAGVAIFPGDVVVGDGDGVVVIPQALTAEIARDAAEQEGIEEFVQLLVARGRPVIGTYPPTDEVRALYREWIAKGKPRDRGPK